MQESAGSLWPFLSGQLASGWKENNNQLARLITRRPAKPPEPHLLILATTFFYLANQRIYGNLIITHLHSTFCPLQWEHSRSYRRVTVEFYFFIGEHWLMHRAYHSQIWEYFAPFELCNLHWVILHMSTCH